MKLEFNRWGSRWFEALPLGNGHLGAMIYGKPSMECIDLTENTFFSGDNKTNNNQWGSKDAFYKMRQYILEGKHQHALEESKNFFGIRGNYGTNIPVGNVYIDHGIVEEKVKNYKRSLNINQGIYQSSFEYCNHIIETESFASHPEKMLVYSAKADDKVLNMSVSVNIYSREEMIEYDKEHIIFHTSAKENIHSDGTTGTALMGIIKLESDGQLCQDHEGVHIKSASYLKLLIKMTTDFDNKKIEQECYTWKRKVDSLFSVDLNACKARHIKDVEGYMNLSELHIEGENQEELDTITKMYQYGRYLLLSSSREDSKLPAHLQGIWNDNVACRIGWTCDMHLDINTQMNYWPTEITNLPKLNTPLFRWIEEKLIPAGTISAKNNYGLEGWVAEIVSNSWGFTAPYWDSPISPCPTGGVWILTHIWEHYLYSEDIEYLNKNFYMIQDAARFFIDYVFWNSEFNYYASGPSISPENSFIIDDKIYQMDIGCTYEITMIRELFSIYLQAAKVLQLQDKMVEKVEGKLQGLLPFQILKDGSIGEWCKEYKEADVWHRHTSHLLGLYPFHQITPENTPELAEAAKRTIEKKFRNYEKWEDTGWARNMIILYAARLHDGDMASYHMKEMLNGLMEVNYMVFHPPTRGAMSFDNVYELDGNTGLTSAIAEVLMQSHNGYIHILPALPKEWRNGYIKGLRARGNILVDICWKNGEVEYVKLIADRDRECKVRFKGSEKKCRLVAHQESKMFF